MEANLRDLASHRRWHYLKDNHRSETIHQCVWFDCETEPHEVEDGSIEHHLVFGWACYRRRSQRGEWLRPEWKRFTSGKELWQWITKKTRPKKCLYVWAHNESFDYCASSVSLWLRKGRWELLSAIVDSPPFLLKYAKSSRKLILVDTLNIWRMSLAQMGKLTGLNKLSMPSTWTGTASDDEYCRRDVEIITKAVCEWADFLQSHDMGKFCLTVASQAMQTFRHRFLDDRILIDADPLALSVARQAYHGGRVECFRVGHFTEPVFMLDVNSLYPHVMASNPFPVRLVRSCRSPSVAELSEVLINYLLCTHVTVHTTEPVIPVVENHKLIFPVGTFDAYVSTPEFQYLLEHQEVLKVHSAAIYEKGFPFAGFVGELYDSRLQARRNGQLVEAEHYKLLLNSFSGKWGQNGIKWIDIGHTATQGIGFMRSINAQTFKVQNYRWFEGLVQRRDTFPESTNSHPAIAAHITAYGRLMLWALIREASIEHTLYCDTDAVLVFKQGFEHLRDRIHDERLGALKLVGEFSECVLNGPKDYVLGGKRVLKGVRDDAQLLSPCSFRQTRWSSFRGLLRRGDLRFPRSASLDKTLKRVYTKGLVGADGRITPFHRVL